jgi:transposase-like protein
MNANKTSCSRCVDEAVKNGKTRGGKQRYLCKSCGKSFVKNPKAIGYGMRFDESIVSFIREGCGIRSTARLLAIAPSTVIRSLLRISETIIPPKIPAHLPQVQVDELHTFIGTKSKEVYVIYSWSGALKRVLSTLRLGSGHVSEPDRNLICVWWLIPC